MLKNNRPGHPLNRLGRQFFGQLKMGCRDARSPFQRSSGPGNGDYPDATRSLAHHVVSTEYREGPN